LKVNEKKSAVARPWSHKFLGLSVTNGLVPKIRVAGPSVARMQSRVREFAARRRGTLIRRMVEELNRFVCGWRGYFRGAIVFPDKWTEQLGPSKGYANFVPNAIVPVPLPAKGQSP
jgi:hypothetical protein